jgi:hypothetical protein
MLKFSPLSVPLAYAVLGLLAARVSCWARALRPGDPRFLLVPFGVYLCLCALNGDSDNIVFSAIKDGLVPTLVVAVSATRLSMIGLPTACGVPRPAALRLADRDCL